MLTHLLKAPPQPELSPEELTEREFAVLRHLAQGLSNKEIARHLQVKPGTVGFHVGNILQKLQVASRVEAILWFQAQGFSIRATTEVTLLQDFVNPETLAALQTVDFERNNVVALFRGFKGSSNYQTVIEQITQKNGQLIVYAQFWEPSPYFASALEITSPYHLVKIEKAQITIIEPTLVLHSYVLTPTPPP